MSTIRRVKISNTVGQRAQCISLAMALKSAVASIVLQNSPEGSEKSVTDNHIKLAKVVTSR